MDEMACALAIDPVQLRLLNYAERNQNEDKPYSRFVQEQLAGDILAEQGAVGEEEAMALRIASGFNRNNMINYEGGAIAEEYLHAYIVDRVNTTTTVWLGLTFACAQCHTHKYDPILHTDYFSFMALLNNADEPTYHIPPADLAQRQADHLAKIGLVLHHQYAERVISHGQGPPLRVAAG